MPGIPREVWQTAISAVVMKNAAFVPPYRSGAALYIRPLVIGSAFQLGLGPANEYTFLTLCTPVGTYFSKDGPLLHHATLALDRDRAAKKGVGHVKCAGNYAADVGTLVAGWENGYMCSLYLDPTEKRYIEEFNSANFVAITKDGTFITPQSPSIVLSNTNKVLRRIASEEFGLEVQVRPIDFFKEVETFAEVGAVGTAAIVAGICNITGGDKVYRFEKPRVLPALRKHIEAIQRGEVKDKFGWSRVIIPAPSS
eukprot:NODE_6463_length_1669_cov_11.561608.p1 GENE.NODE_6463_length_1669_cov_11.561608~~NODE_6463_length_1669_cov_11.561608.p1  ORF type:complete len:254 (+),score=75.87 NODE_6463_length_1669_cov_11.561608:237-998(+)